jgi:hypothetical protein
MKTTMTVVASLLMGLTVGTANAQPAQPAAPAAAAAPAGEAPKFEVPKPAPENDVIKKSAGSWKCTGVAKGPDGQEAKYKSSWTIRPVLGGHWFALTYKRSKMGPMPAFEGNATVGYNLADKKYVLVGFDSFGSWIDLGSSDGAVYTGEGGPGGKKTPAKFSFSPGKDKKGEDSDRLFDVTLEFGVASSTESCKK